LPSTNCASGTIRAARNNPDPAFRQQNGDRSSRRSNEDQK
jgi:hypothetical protein